MTFSDPQHLVWPLCGSDEFHPYSPSASRCYACERALGQDILKTLRQIAALPDTLGKHACECGHPEMRLLPDGVFWCPACGSEVLSLKPP